MKRPRIVVALGGNALLRPGQPTEAATQLANVTSAAAVLATLADEHELIVTHGNAPQIGLLALEADAYEKVSPYPLDVLGAESQGMIGYLLVQALGNRLPGARIAALLTRVAVDPLDASFAAPTKPIGPVYSEREARALARDRAWTVARDGQYFRRVVPSPRPKRIVELELVEELLACGAVVVCAGGGGIPVVAEGSTLRGIEAVIDKDLTAALLAESLGADKLVLATDTTFVERDWGTADARPIANTTPAELRRLRFAAGSMGPKVEAACRFVDRTGGTAAIGALVDLHRLADGTAGTQVIPSRARAVVA